MRVVFESGANLRPSGVSKPHTHKGCPHHWDDSMQTSMASNHRVRARAQKLTGRRSELAGLNGVVEGACGLRAGKGGSMRTLSRLPKDGPAGAIVGVAVKGQVRVCSSSPAAPLSEFLMEAAPEGW